MTFLPWIGFTLLILGLLSIDLFFLHKTPRVQRAREALAWTGVCIALAVGFSVVIYFMYEHHWLGVGSAGLNGREAAIQYFTGFILEQSLSVDNVFVIALIFAYFKVPALYQHRVLFWGVMGALGMRLGMILAGAALLQTFTWMVYVFGAVLIFTAIKMMIAQDEHLDPERNPMVRLVRRFYPVSPEYIGQQFFTRIDGRRAATPMLLVLVCVESADALFAIDSIPAIFAITNDPFIVYTSNMFAILGLRSLYFALAAIMDKVRYLKTSLVFVLAFIGVKMLLSHHYHIPIGLSLAIIGGILGVGVVASVIVSRREGGSAPKDPDGTGGTHG